MNQQPNVSPQEQKQYDAVMLQARGMIYGDPKKPDNLIGFRTILEKLGSGKKDIGVTIGHTAAMIIRSIQTGIQQQGKKVPGDILFHAGMEVVAELIEIAEAANIMSKSQEAKVKKQALFEGMRVFGIVQKTPPPQQPQQPQQPQAAQAQPLQPAQSPQPQGIVGAAMQGA